ncbi:glycosyltransferase [Frankia sp. CNm7]|uniref:Glycosyltransferase n=1 Tax=Frankia nepalensis TaxID=1836974 RepID=A0A937RGZ2_9ACTN|nr:glycosyltransferase [Frankia nepalensis]MBL7496428.1 glycosyltransferase [Frankia nepalensis]MBL7512850.1 glycosyltransferase [Frankia nepalensis]MBL7518345.1 glycosyltransferase [Frankia nepalensis]MBL7630215.1 glycosyltransferase [Frankia nepalensis]
MRIAQVANFVAPTSGGIRTTLRHLAAGYVASGHEVVRVLPARRDGARQVDGVTTLMVRSPLVPGTSYRIITEPWRVAAMLTAANPTHLEVHDRTTLRRLGRWARQQGVHSLVVSHERVDRLLGAKTPYSLRGVLPVRAAADVTNRGLAAGYDTVVTTTRWAAAEFMRLGVDNLSQVPLGVDLDRFGAERADRSLRRAFARDSDVLLVAISRMDPEKRVDIAIDALAELVRRGVPARLVLAGDGKGRKELERRAAGLPVVFLGFVSDRARLSALLASADVALAPGPVETFGLAALEAMASATPVVVHHGSALAELVEPGCGRIAAGCGYGFAEAVEEILALDPAARRAAARARAEQYPWSATVEGFLALHGQEAPPATATPLTLPTGRGDSDGLPRAA